MKLFLDTSAFIAKAIERDKWHTDAIRVFEDVINKKLPYTKYFTSNYVIDETVTFVLYQRSHIDAVRILNMIRESRFLKILRVTEEVEKKADIHFKKYSDQKISYTDCTSKVLMVENGINTAFTFDKDFDIMGFKRIP